MVYLLYLPIPSYICWTIGKRYQTSCCLSPRYLNSHLWNLWVFSSIFVSINKINSMFFGYLSLNPYSNTYAVGEKVFLQFYLLKIRSKTIPLLHEVIIFLILFRLYLLFPPFYITWKLKPFSVVCLGHCWGCWSHA